MIIILGTIALIILLTTASFFGNSKDTRKDSTIIAFVFSTIIEAFFIIAVLGTSYSSYLDIKADYYGVIAQYESAINIYENKAIIDVDKISFTDFKYQGYQKEMSDLIRDLRSRVARYNSIYIKKSTMKKSLIFSWLIIAPDSGMKLLQITQSKTIDKSKRSVNE